MSQAVSWKVVITHHDWHHVSTNKVIHVNNIRHVYSNKLLGDGMYIGEHVYASGIDASKEHPSRHATLSLSRMPNSKKMLF